MSNISVFAFGASIPLATKWESAADLKATYPHKHGTLLAVIGWMPLLRGCNGTGVGMAQIDPIIKQGWIKILSTWYVAYSECSPNAPFCERVPASSNAALPSGGAKNVCRLPWKTQNKYFYWLGRYLLWPAKKDCGNSGLLFGMFPH